MADENKRLADEVYQRAKDEEKGLRARLANLRREQPAFEARVQCIREEVLVIPF